MVTAVALNGRDVCNSMSNVVQPTMDLARVQGDRMFALTRVADLSARHYLLPYTEKLLSQRDGRALPDPQVFANRS